MSEPPSFNSVECNFRLFLVISSSHILIEGKLITRVYFSGGGVMPIGMQTMF